MNTGFPEVVTLREHETTELPDDTKIGMIGEFLYSNYRKTVTVDPPSFKNNYTWQLTPQGWAGFIPVSPDLGVRLEPKVPLYNLFRMLEYAYNLQELQFLSSFHVASIEDFYEQLATILARRVMRRSRQGLYRAYVPRSDSPPYIRGQLDVQEMARAPWQVKHRCHYEEHTVDVTDNQIPEHTLRVVARTHMYSEERRLIVHRAYQCLQGLITPRHVSPQECIGRHYTRLNQDYAPIHALCRFFLENTGPTHEAGSRTMLPFLVYMPHVFEQFVAQWLKHHLPERYEATPQERLNFGTHQQLFFDVDLVLRDATTREVLAVLDTKYKYHDQPQGGDVAQVVAYAEAYECDHSILIFPHNNIQPLHERVGNKYVQTGYFALDQDIEIAGRNFLDQLSPIPALNLETSSFD